MKKYLINSLALAFSFLFCYQQEVNASESTVKKIDGQWKLLVDGKPFTVKGATFGRPYTKDNIGIFMKDLKSLGVNTIRTWGTGKETQLLLDSANAYGIKVMVGIWMRHGRPGMEGDDSFDYINDKKGREAMFKDAVDAVKLYKNHPAVLIWGVGNEVTLNLATDPEKKAYAQFLETVIQAIKAEDTRHAVASVSAWTFDWKWWKEFTPSLDIYGINVYGGGANQIPDEETKLGVDKPYLICEYGVNGEWEAKPDKNGLLVEPNDKQKYDVIAKGYSEWIASKPSCLGVYVFHYGNGTDHGAVWLNMYFNNCYRPAYWATREAYTGRKPLNYIPEISVFSLPDQPKAAGEWIPVKLQIDDAEKDSLQISFHYNQRTGSRTRRDQINILEFRGNLKTGYEILLPRENGLIKVYVFAKDSYNNLGIAQTSFVIDNGRNTDRLIPGAKVTLPFYVYDEGKQYPYLPTGYMGDFQQLKVDGENKEQVHTGSSALKISYTNSGGWYGLAFVDPPDDWGDRAGGFNLMQATKLTFWAKASTDALSGTFGLGMIGNDKPFYDTGKKSEKFQLTREWKKYEIDIKGMDLRCIKTGFIMYLGGIGESYSFWLDDIRYE
jgi:hypothetical protein